MAVETLEDISLRLRAALEKDLTLSFPLRTSARKLLAACGICVPPAERLYRPLGAHLRVADDAVGNAADSSEDS